MENCLQNINKFGTADSLIITHWSFARPAGFEPEKLFVKGVLSDFTYNNKQKTLHFIMQGQFCTPNGTRTRNLHRERVMS